MAGWKFVQLLDDLRNGQRDRDKPNPFSARAIGTALAFEHGHAQKVTVARKDRGAVAARLHHAADDIHRVPLAAHAQNIHGGDDGIPVFIFEKDAGVPVVPEVVHTMYLPMNGLPMLPRSAMCFSTSSFADGRIGDHVVEVFHQFDFRHRWKHAYIGDVLWQAAIFLGIEA